MNVKNEELDQENRRLRTLKCELETKVLSCNLVLAIRAVPAVQTRFQDHSGM